MSRHSVSFFEDYFPKKNRSLPYNFSKTKYTKLGDWSYVLFQTSDMVQDAGQNTVPLIDTQAVEPYPHVLLSGAGLYLKGTDISGGFLGIKLITYDISSFHDMDDNEVNNFEELYEENIKDKDDYIEVFGIDKFSKCKKPKAKLSSLLVMNNVKI